MKAFVFILVVFIGLVSTLSTSSKHPNTVNKIYPKLRRLLAKNPTKKAKKAKKGKQTKKNKAAKKKKPKRRKGRKGGKKKKNSRRKGKNKVQVQSKINDNAALRILTVSAPVQLRTQLTALTDPKAFRSDKNRKKFIKEFALLTILKTADVYITSVRSTPVGNSLVDIVVNPETKRPVQPLIDLIKRMSKLGDMRVFDVSTITTTNDHSCAPDFPFYPYGKIPDDKVFWEYNGGPQEVYQRYKEVYPSKSPGVNVPQMGVPIALKEKMKVVVSEMDLERLDVSKIKPRVMAALSERCRSIIKETQRKDAENGFWDQDGLWIKDSALLANPGLMADVSYADAFVSNSGYDYYGGYDSYGYTAYSAGR